MREVEDLRGRVEAAPTREEGRTADELIAALHGLVAEWKELSGLPTPLTFATLEKASPAQRTLWEAAHDLDEVLAERTPLSSEDEARAYRLREVALQERLRRDREACPASPVVAEPEQAPATLARTRPGSRSATDEGGS